MSMLSSAIGGIGKAVTAPLRSVGNILQGKMSLADIISIASSFAPGFNLANLGAKGLAGLSSANALANFGTTQGLMGVAGLPTAGAKTSTVGAASGTVSRPNLLAGKGTGLDYFQAANNLLGATSSPQDRPNITPFTNWGGQNSSMSRGSVGMNIANFAPGESGGMPDANRNGIPDMNETGPSSVPPGSILGQVAGRGFTIPGSSNSTATASTAPVTFKDPKKGLNALAQAGYPAALDAMAFWSGTRPLERETRMNAFSQLDPSMNFVRAEQQGAAAMKKADAQGRQSRVYANAQGFSPAMGEGMALAARETGTQAANDAVRSAMDPDMIIKQTGMQLSLLDDNELLAGADRIRQMISELEQLKAGKASSGGTSMNGIMAGLLGTILADPNTFGGGNGGNTAATQPVGPSAVGGSQISPTTPRRGTNPLEFRIGNFSNAA